MDDTTSLATNTLLGVALKSGRELILARLQDALNRFIITIVDFFLHRSASSTSWSALVRERVYPQLFDDFLGDSDFFEPIGVDQYFEILIVLRDLAYDILKSNEKK